MNFRSLFFIFFGTIQLCFAQKRLTLLEQTASKVISNQLVYLNNEVYLTSSAGQIEHLLATDSLIIEINGYTAKKIKNTDGQTVYLSLNITELNPVVVSANRQLGMRSESPISIYKLNDKQIVETRANFLTELLNKVPGVIMANFNHEQHTVAIRQPIGLNPYFLYLEDGIPIRPVGIFQNNGLIEINQAAIENLEVVKGPNSSLYGPEAAGGAINFNSIAPSANKKLNIGFQQDNFGYQQWRARYTGMITKKWGISAAIFKAKQRDSWQANSDFDKISTTFRTDYTFSTTDKLIFHFTQNHYDAQAGGSVDSTTFYSRNYQSQAPFAYRKIDALRARLTWEHRWNDKNQSTIHLIGRDNVIAQFPAYAIRRVTNRPTIANGERNSNNFRSLGVIIQNNHQLSTKHKLTTGLSYEAAPNDYWAYWVGLNRNTSTGAYTVRIERPDSMLVDYRTDIQNIAAYFQWQYQINKQLSLTTSGRYDAMVYDFDNFLKPTAFSGAPDERNSFQRFSPKVGLNYQKSSNFGGYVNVSQGFSPPMISQMYRGVKVPELKAALFNNSELGFWYSWKNKILLDFATYYMPSKNEVVRFVNADNSVENKSAGSAVHYGIEYSVTWKATKDLKISLNGTNARHIFKEFRLSEKQIFDNKEMPQAPHFSGFGEIMYKPCWLKGFRISAEWQRVGSFYKDNENKNKYDDRTFMNLKGLSLLHLRTGYQWKGIEIYANLLNATDELYTTYISRSAFGSNFYPTAPRNFTFGVNVEIF